MAPQYFGTFGTSLFTMFTMATTEGWPDVAAAVMAHQPQAWVFFVAYMVVTAFISSSR